MVQLFGRERSVRRRDDHIPPVYGLHERRIRMHAVAQALLDDEITAEGVLVAAALLV